MLEVSSYRRKRGDTLDRRSIRETWSAKITGSGVAERDENGNVIGNRLGVEGIDWHYELRWYPPTPVNADGGVAPAVRDLNQILRRFRV